jgi:hypothetical protein
VAQEVVVVEAQEVVEVAKVGDWVAYLLAHKMDEE